MAFEIEIHIMSPQNNMNLINEPSTACHKASIISMILLILTKITHTLL
jgi:hypothetical protein